MLDTTFIERCLQTLERAYQTLQKTDASSLDYDLFRAACVKEFELVLEQVGKLLKKVLKPYFHSSKEVDKLTFKEIFRSAAKHSLLTIDETERWLKYRDNRNHTAHDYGESFAENTLSLLPSFLVDTKSFIEMIKSLNQ